MPLNINDEEPQDGPYQAALSGQPEQAQPAQAARPSQGNSTQSGYLNFDSFYGANEGAAKAGAQRLNEGVKKQANKAKTGQQGLSSAYDATLHGQGKAADDRYDASGNWTGGAAGPQGGATTALWDSTGEAPYQDELGNVVTKYVTDENGAQQLNPNYHPPQNYEQGLTGTTDDPNRTYKFEGIGEAQPTGASTRPSDHPPGWIEAPPAETPEEKTQREAYNQALVDAQASGAGIGKFTDQGGYKAALDDAGMADEELGLLGNDSDIGTLGHNNAADAALFGSAGRKDFADTQHEFGTKDKGSTALKDSLNKAREAGDKAGEAAKKKFSDRADYYKSQLSGMDKTLADKTKGYEERKAAREKDEAARGDLKKRHGDFTKYLADADKATNHIRDLIDASSPGNNIWNGLFGEQSPAAALGDKVDGGRKSTLLTEDDFGWWDKMSEEERKKFEQAVPHRQEEIINAKRRGL